jgi:hypothetical protein
MPSKILLFPVTAALALTVACSSGVQVRTTLAPDASLAGLHTFRILAAPERRATAPVLDASDPMLNNSITNRQLRNDLTQGLVAKGYTAATTNADFLVAYYAGTMEKMDTTYWNPSYRYGYRGYGLRRSRYAWAWPYSPLASPFGPTMQVQSYTQGTVIVDVIDPANQELLWRGQGVANVSADPAAYAKDLSQSVNAILTKFPQAGP